ncbi:hypothetical protein DQ04_02701050 [Trypanosoma grayi]|uniref:hypothetical protein n=1 Tax=Trypanosoma grayi TaxID=71804 RepID=UPI0004F4135B|nr:hypothetical protein DQ04_02701050 [Trypanosoma grayi]KEG11366.1 hypothetical protein DQ04_02701050 [Trypanosoma grayi]
MMLPRQRQHQRRVALLPCDRGLPDAPLCVVMDLDETLVTARRECVYPRPHVRELLDTCHAEGCEVVVWSAGSPLHVNNVIRVIAEVAQRRDWYHHIISRHRRWYRDDNEMVKDLSALGRPLNRVLLLENSPQLILQQPGHVVLVEDYVRPTVHDDSLRIFAGVVRRVAAGMRGASDEATPDVPRLLAADAALINLSFPSSHPSAAEGVLCCRGITYSPQNVFALRSYGGMHPLPAEKMRDA